MEKTDNFDKEPHSSPEEHPENNMMKEPAIEYEIQEEIKILPLTEEDLKECITGDELLEYIYEMIDKHFDK